MLWKTGSLHVSQHRGYALANELITLGGHSLTGLDRDGTWKVNTPLVGWFGRPQPKSSMDDLVNADGVQVVPVEYGSRLITINGRVSSRRHEYLHEAAGLLSALGFRGDTVLQVSGHGPAQWARVWPRGEVQVDFVTDTYMTYQLQLEAPDPFKYGEKRTESFALGGSGQVMHRGSVPAWPVVTVTGSAPGGYTLTRAGRDVTVTAPLVSGQPHTLDMRTGVLRAGGSRVYGAISTAQYWTVAPGLRQTVTASGTGTATVRVDVYDTWI